MAEETDRRRPQRPIRIDGTWAYLDRLGASPGERIQIHASSSSAFEVEVVELGSSALFDPDATVADDRRDVRVLDQIRFDAAVPQPITPGSYVEVEGTPVESLPITIGLWLRLWSLPPSDLLVADWGGLISDFDYPHRCGWALLVNEAGEIVTYAGDGGTFRPEWQHTAWATTLHSRLGEWVHLAASIDSHSRRLFVDGELAEEAAVDAAPRIAEHGVARIGATAEGGLVSRYLDGDVAQPFIGRFSLAPADARRLADLRGLGEVAGLGLGPIAASWPLREQRGSRVSDGSGNGHHGILVSGGTWQIGGPSASPESGGPGYDPGADPERGNGLRLSSDDLLDCAWKPVHGWTVPAETPSGLYGVRVRSAGADVDSAFVMPFAVTDGSPPAAGAVAVLIPTNTWHAYGRVPTERHHPHGLRSSYYSRRRSGRMFFELGTRLPLPNIDAHGFQTPRAEFTRHQHTVRSERMATAWLRREGYEFACVTDEQLDRDPGMLEGYAAVMLVGHSEYWSRRMRDGVLAYLAAGGNLFSMSGNTLYWRVSLDHERGVVEARKTSYPAEGEFWGSLWLSRAEWRERWHTADGLAGGLWELIGEPAEDLLGTAMQGLIEEGSPRSFAPYEVEAPDHFLFADPEPVPLEEGRRLGVECLNGTAAAGYEVDALPHGKRPPAGLTVLAGAKQPLIAAENEDLQRGAQIVYWQRPGGGVVVSTGSIAFAGSLPCDASVQAFTRNVLAHFGVSRSWSRPGSSGSPASSAARSPAR